MKKILLNALSLALMATSYSQLTITRQFYEQYSDTTLNLTVDNATEINIGTAAANGTWDVSNAVITERPTVSILSLYDASLPGASEFSTATHYADEYEIQDDGSLIGSGSPTYSKINDSGEEILGSLSHDNIMGSEAEIITKMNPPLKVMTFPFEYQNTITNNSTLTGTAAGVANITGSIIGTYTYEGWGKVKFPGATTYTNCARLSSTTNTQSSSSASYEGLTYKVTITGAEMSVEFVGEDAKSFFWQRASTRTVTQIMPLGITVNDTTIVDTTVSYSRPTTASELRDIVLSKSDERFFSGVLVYPNPTAERVYFNSAMDVATVEVISSNGNSYTTSPVSNSVEILGDKGLYMIKLTLQNGASKAFKVVKN